MDSRMRRKLLDLIEAAPSLPDPRSVRGHARAEARSMALHRQIAIKIVDDPDLLERHVLPTIARFKKIHAGTTSVRALDEWEAAVCRGVESVVHLCIDEGEEGKRLRQSTPLVGILDEAERMKIHAAFAP